MMQDITLATLLIWILVSFGITLSVTRGKIFDPIRQRALKINSTLGQLLQCPMCLGFWVGIFLSLFWQSLSGNCFLDGCLSLCTNSLLYFLSWYLALKDGHV